MSPRSVSFRAQREASWTDLDVLADRVLERGLASLDAGDLRRLPVLYRHALSSLSVARTTAQDRSLVSYLEALCTRAYLAIHGSRRPASHGILRLFAIHVPRAVRALWGELVIATLVFALGIAVAFALGAADPWWFDAFVEPGLAGGRGPGSTTETLRQALYDTGSREALSEFAAFLFTHNARVGMIAFALGFAAGVPTLLLVFGNGLTLGAFLALYAQHGSLGPFLGWLLPHGVPEITAMLLCAAAGLAIGRAVVLPGARTVGDALRRAGRRAAVVVVGSMALFAIAGVLEGVLRQVILSDGVRFALAAANFAWLAAWLLGAARKQEQDHGQ